jgi:hypothetical protein
MGEFYAWAVTGQVTSLQVWSDADARVEGTDAADDASSMRIANKMVDQQKFTLRSREGGAVEVHLLDSGVAVQNGHIATVVWAAREGSSHGHCIFIRNHTTGATARLLGNIPYVRSAVSAGKVAGFGLLATLPATLAILTWLLIPGSLADIDISVFLVGASIGLVVLFSVGAIVSKLVLEFLRSDDDEKIWTAVNKALASTPLPLHRPNPRAARRF